MTDQDPKALQQAAQQQLDAGTQTRLKERLQQQYAANKRARSFKALVLGRYGTGKTCFAVTGRKPVLFHSFDPGGTTSIRQLIDAGAVLPDIRFEEEDSKNPTAFNLWVEEMKKLEQENAFHQIGTYVLDSLTTFSAAVMNQILFKAGKVGAKPTWDEYSAEHNHIIHSILELTRLPCDVIITAHLESEKDEVSGRLGTVPLVTGKLKTRIPNLFDEVYVMLPRETPTGITYGVLTRNTGYYQAKSRLGNQNQLEASEAANLKVILQKTGMPFADL